MTRKIKLNWETKEPRRVGVKCGVSGLREEAGGILRGTINITPSWSLQPIYVTAPYVPLGIEKENLS